MVELEEVGRIIRKFLIPLLVITIILVTFAILYYGGFLKIPTLGTSIPAIFSTPDVTSLFWSYDTSGFLYPTEDIFRPLNSTELSSYFNLKPVGFDCNDCSGCSASVYDSSTGNWVSTASPTYDEATKQYVYENCTQCNKCDNIAGTYDKCQSCIASNPASCDSCTDENSDTNLCEAVKGCIKDIYVNNGTCSIDNIARTGPFDLNLLQTRLSGCTPESVKIRISQGVEKEICYFDPSALGSSSITSFDIKNPSNWVTYPPNNGDVAHRCRYGEGAWWAECSRYQPLDFAKQYPIFKISGVWKPSWKGQTGGPESGSDIILYLCVDRGDGGPTIDPNSGSSDPCYSKDWNSISSAGNLCEAKDKGACIEKVDSCYLDSCQGTMRSFHAYYSGKATRVAALACAKSPDYGDLCQDGGWGGGIAIDYFSAHIYLDSDYTSSLLYPRCIPTPDYFDTNKIYYDPTENAMETYSNSGYTKVALGKLDYQSQKNCNFNIYSCSSNAFANSTDDASMQIFNFIESFDSKYQWKDLGNDKVKYNYVSFLLDRNYTPQEITTAIINGYKYWSIVNYPVIANDKFLEWADKVPGDIAPADNWVVSSSTDVNFNNNCWSSSSDWSSNSVIYNCPNNICRGEIKVNIAFKKGGVADYSPDVIDIYPMITFCSE